MLGKEQIILVKAEDYYKDRIKSVTEILQFLEIGNQHISNFYIDLPQYFYHAIGQQQTNISSHIYKRIPVIFQCHISDDLPERFLRMLRRKKPLNTRKMWRARSNKGLHRKTKQLLDKLYAPLNRALAKLYNDDKWLWSEDST